MLKKLDSILNIVMGTCFGVFLGHAIYVFWDYRAHPGLYAAWSAPWYTSIQVYGMFTAVIFAVGAIIKHVVRKKLKQM